MRARIPRLVAVLVVLSVLLGGCLRQRTEVVAATDSPGGPRPGGVPVSWVTVGMGATVLTGQGNHVTVSGFDPDVELSDGTTIAAAEVRVCAGSREAVLSPEFFLLEVQREQLRPPRDATGLLKDALTRAEIAPRRCVEGWVPFEIRSADEPVAVLLAASTFVRWERTPVRD